MAWGNFITLPCPVKKWDDKLKNLMLAMLPSVGAVVSALFVLIMWGMDRLGVPTMIAAVVAEFYFFYIHGFMHLDGFMDCTDAIMSRRPLEERQRIMKDPTVGSFAVVMTVFLLLAWFVCFYTAISTFYQIYWVIAVIPIMSRGEAGDTVLSYKPIGHSQYVEDYKQEGKFKYRLVIYAQEIIYLLTLSVVFWRVMGSTVATNVAVRMAGLIMFVVTQAAVILFGSLARKDLGGMSGDIAGYEIVTAELAGVAAAALLAAYAF